MKIHVLIHHGAYVSCIFDASLRWICRRQQTYISNHWVCVQTVERTEAVSAAAGATSAFGPLPWSRSVSGEGAEALLYMPFVDYQIRHIKEQGGAREVPVEPHLAYRRSSHHTAHIGASHSPVAPCTRRAAASAQERMSFGCGG
jgi:hypothetical protein